MALQAGTAYLDVLPLLKNFSKELEKQATPLLTKVAGKMKSVGKTLTRSVTLPIVAAGVASVKMAIDFDSTFNKIKALSGSIGMGMGKARDSVLALADATGQDPGGLANALYFAASAGLKTSKVMPVLTASAQAAEAQFSDAQTAAQLLTSTLNAYAGTGLNAAKAMDVLTATIRVGKAEPADLAESLGTVITAAAQAKISFAQVGAAIATATDLGVPAARAITGLRFLISNISAPTAKAAGVLKDFGISIGDLQTAVAKKGLIATMQMLATKFDLTTVKGKAAWAAITGGARGAIVANTLVGKSAELANKNLEATSHSAGDFQTALDKMKASPAVQMQIAFTHLKTAAIKLGEVLIPFVQKAADWIAKLADGFKGLSPFAQKIVVLVLALVAALGPLLLIVGTVVGAIAAMTLVTGIVIVAIVALIAIVALLVANWGVVKRVTQTVWHAIEHYVGWNIGLIIGWVADLLIVILSAFTGIVHGAALAFGWIPGIGDKLKAADEAFQGWKDHLIAGLRATSAHFKTFGSQAATAAAKANEQMKALNLTLLAIARNSHIHVSIDQSGALHGGTGRGRARGGPLRAGEAYLVNEGRPEVLTGVNGNMIPLDKLAMGGGGRQALTITNWEEGTGYLVAVASDVDRDDANFSRGASRMRVPS